MVQSLLLMAIRIANTAAKFLLTIYTARYLGLADLGAYGLLVGATTMIPVVLGLGTTDWVMRHIATMPRDEAIASTVTRLALPVVLHLVIQPILWVVNYALGEPVSWQLLLIGGAILFLDHVLSDVSNLLIGRGRIYLASILSFIRAGLWPPAVIVWGIFDPSARTLQCVLLGWLGALILTMVVLATQLFSQSRWRAVGMRASWIAGGVRASVPFYIKDLTGSVSLYLDRFLLSAFLGLEVTGVYTLFWSVANVLHSLVVYSVVQPNLRRMIESARQPDQASFRTLERKLQMEGGVWIAVLVVAASIALLLLLPLLGKPLVQQNLPVFWIVLAATALRASADSYGFVMLALRQDKAIAIVGVGGAIASAILNLALLPVFGLSGAALAYLLTSGGMLAARYAMTRDSCVLRSCRSTP